MAKYRITRCDDTTDLYNVQRRFFGFLWVTVRRILWLHQAEQYIENRRNPIVKEFL